MTGPEPIAPESIEPEPVEAEEGPVGAPEPEPVPLPEPFVQVRFVDVVMVLPSTSPVVILEEVSPPGRQLRIPIGTPEGVAIGYAARGIATAKPLTHELAIRLLEAFSLTLDAVRVTGVEGASFSAELVCSGPGGTRTLACRPSDGIGLALRQRLRAPLLVSPAVLDQVGVGGAGEG